MIDLLVAATPMLFVSWFAVYILGHFRHYIHITSYAEHKAMIFPYRMIDLAAFAYQIFIGIIVACVTANFAFGVVGLYYTSLLTP